MAGKSPPPSSFLGKALGEKSDFEVICILVGAGIEPDTKGCFRYRVLPEREFKGRTERRGDTQPQPT